MLRFLNPTKGSIFIDEVNMQDIPIQDVRTHICSASQNPYMFNMSIADNINMGRTNKCIDDEEFMHMKQLLDIDEFLHYPDDYYLLYGKERKLSGGQKQRLCLMRTLLAKPKILLIDEALSGFDAWHEEKVVKYILNEYKDVLKIIISNRITTLRNLDYILVLINGEIVEQGTHDDLIVQMGFYADFYNKQILRMDMQQYDNKK